MYRLTRQVRFAINSTPDDQLCGRATNGFAGFPSLTGLGHFFALEATLEGPLDPTSQYLVNIKQIDAAVRERIVPTMEREIRAGTWSSGTMMLGAFDLLKAGWGERAHLHSLRLALSPYLSLSTFAWEVPMIRVSQKFEFSASHRLHNPGLSDEANQHTFGKCNNPSGHGHNYELQVTLRGAPTDENRGIPMPIVPFERIVAETIIDRLDHKNLNEQVVEFRELIPSVENIARVIYRLLKPKFEAQPAKLASVTVWETPKTWCEYSE